MKLRMRKNSGLAPNWHVKCREWGRTFALGTGGAELAVIPVEHRDGVKGRYRTLKVSNGQ